MTTANDIRGVVFKNGPATLMARIVGPEGDAIAPSDVALLHYSVLEVDHSDHDTLVPVEGHDNVELDPDEMFYDELVTGPPWTMDDLGYNFRHDLAIAEHDAFPTAGVEYQVRYEVVPVVGQRMVFRFLVTCI